MHHYSCFFQLCCSLFKITEILSVKRGNNYRKSHLFDVGNNGVLPKLGLVEEQRGLGLKKLKDDEYKSEKSSCGCCKSFKDYSKNCNGVGSCSCCSTWEFFTVVGRHLSPKFWYILFPNIVAFLVCSFVSVFSYYCLLFNWIVLVGIF